MSHVSQTDKRLVQECQPVDLLVDVEMSAIPSFILGSALDFIKPFFRVGIDSTLVDTGHEAFSGDAAEREGIV